MMEGHSRGEREKNEEAITLKTTELDAGKKPERSLRLLTRIYV